ncbi:MAG: aldehyde dehydrogenase family protein [Candidatus Eisenbacteria bacterium]
MVSDEERISALVDTVMGRLAVMGERPETAPDVTGARGRGPERRDVIVRGKSTGVVHRDADSATRCAERSQETLVSCPLKTRREIIQAMREAAARNALLLSRMAVKETGLGRTDDKVKKNLLVAEKTPGTEDLNPLAWSGDRGLTLTEWAPYGVIASITPSTNPSETVINNAIGMVAAGNSVVFCPHPSAKETTLATVEVLNDAIASVSGIENLLVSFEDPSIELAQELMKHGGIDLLVVTGGPAVVRAAMNCGKKVIAAGPGNPPVLVDETADLEKAGKDILDGASLDNNIVCIAEKEIIVVDAAADRLKASLVKAGALELEKAMLPKLERLLLAENRGAARHSVVNRDFVGKSVRTILGEIGLEVGEDVRLAFVETSWDHPFVWTEMLMPIVPLVKVREAEEGMALAKSVEQGFGHTALIHSKDIERLSRMARLMQVSIFVKNGPSFAGLGLGGEGYTSFTIASPTGEGLTCTRHFTRMRRCVLVDYFRIV